MKSLKLINLVGGGSAKKFHFTIVGYFSSDFMSVHYKFYQQTKYNLTPTTDYNFVYFKFFVFYFIYIIH